MARTPPLDARRRGDPTPLSDTVTSRTPMPMQKTTNAPGASTPDDMGSGAPDSEDMTDMGDTQEAPATLDSISQKLDMLTQLLVSWYGQGGMGGQGNALGMISGMGGPQGGGPMPGGPGGY